jgi:hypothetical protein
MKIKHLLLGASLLGAPACGGEDNPGPLGNIDSLVVLQRPARNDMGDIFQYTSYIPKTPSGATARLVKLTPPTADGKQETLFPSAELLAGPDAAMFQDTDISGYDISFDANEIVISARTAMTSHYGLYVLTLSTGQVDAIPTDPGRDYVNPIWMPGNKIMFTTNSPVEELDAAGGAITPRQHVDEYERGTTLQVGLINRDGTAETLGARNLSHRTFPSLASDGRIIFTQWDHLGPENAGHLMFVDADMTNMREAFGKEGTGASNSTIKAQEIAPGRFVAIATARNRTIQSGDVYINAFRPLGPPGTHHTVLTTYTGTSPADGTVRCGVGTNGQSMIYGSGVGAPDFEFPPGVGLFLRKGQRLLLNLHLYNATDLPMTGRSGALYKPTTAAETPNIAELVLAGPTATLNVPTGVSTQSGNCQLSNVTSEPIHVFALSQHMHKLGTHLKTVINRPTELVLQDEPYNFEEQKFHLIEPHIELLPCSRSADEHLTCRR